MQVSLLKSHADLHSACRSVPLPTGEFLLSYVKGTKKQFFIYFFVIFSMIFRIFRAAHLNFPSFFAGARAWARGDRARAWAGACEEGWKMCFSQHGFFKPLTSPKKVLKLYFFYIFAFFPIYSAPSGAKDREKGWAVTKIG